MPLASGTRLGPYEILGWLGAGGMGEVYRAHDSRLSRDVALKILPPDVAHDADRVRRFEQEARAASALNHPAIVTIYDIGEAGSDRYITMELVKGRTLRDLIAEGPISPKRALQLAAPVADGLARAHEAGIVHRDLKPENVMVTDDGFVKILDFGLAKLVASSDAGAAETRTQKGTQPGHVMGTVGYMSPEQVSGAATDGRSDQFTLGLMLYEMLCGQRAFTRPTAVETMSAIVRDDPTPLDQRTQGIPPLVRWIVERCLAKAPADRYGTTRDLARDLATARDRYTELMAAGPALASPPRIRVREAVGWSLAVVAVVAAVILFSQANRVPASDDAGRVVRFALAAPEGTVFENAVGAAPFALSPDGRQIAFVAARAKGLRTLFLQSLDAVAPREIAGTEGARGPFWSADGKSVGFFADKALNRLDVIGGSVATICPAPQGGGGATWNQEGVILFAPSVDTALYRVPAAGGTPVAVTTVDTAGDQSAHLSPVFLPDGHRFVFWVLGGPKAGIYLGSLDSPAITRLTPDLSTVGFAAPDWLFLMRDRRLTAVRLDAERATLIDETKVVAENVGTVGPTSAFAVSLSGTVVHWPGLQDMTQLTWVRRDGTPDGTIGPVGSFVNVEISPDGRQVAADRWDPQPAIWVMDVRRGTTTRETFGGAYESTPVWAPDSSRFVYAASSDLPPNVFQRRVGGGADDGLVFRNRMQSFPQAWAPDGRVIVTTIDPETGADLWIMPMEGDHTPSVLIRTPNSETHARVSPDGRWLAYQSNESGGRLEVYVTSFPRPEGRVPVSNGGGTRPIWSHNGRELYYVAPGGAVMAVGIGAGRTFEPGVPASLFKIPGALRSLGIASPYDAAADGRFLVNLPVERRSPPATVVINWRGQ